VFNSKHWTIALACALLLGAGGWLYAALGGKAHLMEQPCSHCHVGGNTVDPARADRLVGSQEMLCGICHKNARRMSHPSGFPAAGKTPADLPLDWKGDLTCSTCHEVHGTQPGLMRGNKRGKTLCLACHDKAFFAAMKDGGSSLQQSGHALPSEALNQVNVGIDALSLQCMGCHNKQTDAMGVRVGSNGIVRHNSGGANHPIGVPYPVFDQGHSFKSKGSLPKEIWLPDGKLSCVSCHQPYKKEHGKLVVTNANSSLCLQCHSL